jgi:hypothetical protein
MALATASFNFEVLHNLLQRFADSTLPAARVVNMITSVGAIKSISVCLRHNKLFWEVPVGTRSSSPANHNLLNAILSTFHDKALYFLKLGSLRYAEERKG